MGSCAAPSAKGDDKFITTDYLQQCRFFGVLPPALLKKMVLAQFKKDVDNLQALAQKGEAYESVGNE
ncbi:hypothetical protein L1A47_19915, partial [Acinetobacter baumannii]